jgi:hypothetical protein
MSAPEHRHASDKWVDEAMDLVTLVVVAKQRDGVLRQSKLFPEARDKLEAHLQRQAYLMERMGEALAVVAKSGEFTCFNDSHWDTVNAALTAFQESKQ